MEYRLKNIDCAVCASKIETELKKVDQFKNAYVDPALNTLTIDSNDLQLVETIIHKVEPDVKVEKLDRKIKPISADKSKIRQIIVRILLVLALFVVGMVFRKELQATEYGWAEYLLFITAYLISGWGVILKAVKNALQGRVFDEHFLMTIATLGAIIIQELPEAVAVMWFYNVGEFVEGLAVNRSRNSIRALLEVRPEFANVITAGKIISKSPEDVSIGEKIIVKPGEKIPLDGIILEGSSLVDTYPLTGESIPRKCDPGENILAGMINKTGILTVEVTKNFNESSISKILELVENASSKKAETEKFITTFARYYTPVIVIIALCIAFLPPLFNSSAQLSDWVYRALVILVISCPCALVISIPLGYFGGIGGASRRGILVKGSNYLDALAKLKTIVFDKTGTLTRGVFKVTRIVPSNGYSESELLKFAAYAEYYSSHPIAQSVKEAFGNEIVAANISNHQEISGQGIKAEVNGDKIIAGNDRMLHTENIKHHICDVEGTVVHIAVNKIYAGYIIISDIIKDDAKQALDDLRKEGVTNITMFTGDNESSAKIVAAELGIESYKAELLPEDKLTGLEEIISSAETNDKVAFVGDGINDSPVIARADVGIAMGALGSDAAVEAADIVIMTDHLSKIPEAVSIAKRTRNIVLQNIVFALVVKGLFVALGGFGLANMWEAVFADMGVALIAILNATRVLRIK
ncbi:MAG: cadmium-translocating P-type ATPase [Ignavibacteriae bacterium]|nr:MAG: cadmium-translocating P-type ATPase [Ignavibacteriota bacterium]